MTTTASPLSNVNWVTLVAAVALAASRIGRSRRRRLITRRRRRQRRARRFLGECRRWTAVAAHQPVQTKDAALVAELARRQLAAHIRFLDRTSRLRRIRHPSGA